MDTKKLKANYILPAVILVWLFLPLLLVIISNTIYPLDLFIILFPYTVVGGVVLLLLVLSLSIGWMIKNI